MQRSNATRLLTFVAVAAFASSLTYSIHGQTADPVEAPAGFDNRTNGYLAPADFNAARQTFQERDTISKGLGPLYNAQSCAECHQNPVSGGVSQITEVRAGYVDG